MVLEDSNKWGGVFESLSCYISASPLLSLHIFVLILKLFTAVYRERGQNMLPAISEDKHEVDYGQKMVANFRLNMSLIIFQ